MAEINRCEATVSDQTGWHRLRCSRKGRVERDGHWYCKVHDPEYIKAKDEERTKKYNAKWNERKTELTAYKACVEINPDNPMAVAENIKDMYEALKELHKVFFMDFQTGYTKEQNEALDKAFAVIDKTEG